MNDEWRHVLAAVRFIVHRPAGDDGEAPPHGAMRFMPLGGIVLGVLGAFVYWSSAALLPASLAVVLSMMATALATHGTRATRFGAVYWLFLLLIKYNALMALTSASLPIALPPNVGLGLIMTAAQAASYALMVSVVAMRTDEPARGPGAALPRVSNNDLGIALIVGLAPAALLGMPGLVGLVAAIMMRLGWAAFAGPPHAGKLRERLDYTQHLTEACFYLGALASWKYV